MCPRPSQRNIDRRRITSARLPALILAGTKHATERRDHWVDSATTNWLFARSAAANGIELKDFVLHCLLARARGSHRSRRLHPRHLT